jgi:hypothetical protein
VTHSIIGLLTQLATRQQRDLWATIVKSFSNEVPMLRNTAVTVVFRDTDNNVCSREIGLHAPPTFILGVYFSTCGNRDCRPLPGHIRYKNWYPKGSDRRLSEIVRQCCQKCGYKSPWVKTKVIDWAHPFPGQNSIYWHDYPVTPQQLQAFSGGEIGTPPSRDNEGRKSKKQRMG